MADTAAAKARLRRYVANLHRSAIEQQLDLLTQGVPRGSGPSRGGQRLAESRQVTQNSETSTTITYPTPVANYTNDGVAEHPIVARNGKVLVFVWPAGPPALASPRGSATFRFPRVMWRPGYGVANNIGWWDRRVNPEQWHRLLERAQSTVEF